MQWIDAIRARLRLLFLRDAAEARMNDEFRFHLEMEAERLMREESLEAGEARRRALIAFGGVDKHQEQLREGRQPAWLAGWSLDAKVGLRMLVKYPGLTVLGGLAMAFAIWIGVVTFQLVNAVLYPSLPLPDGDRVVELRNWDAEASAVEARALHDFVAWRDALRTVTDIGAFRDDARNLVVAGEDAALVEVAEITSSAFRIAPQPPLLGRTLQPADEQPGAPMVVVLGHDVWRLRFAGDAGVIGRTVRIGDTDATVVGVMPAGYAFPIAHEAWLPLRVEDASIAPRTGPGITVFARLAPGVSLREARAELTAAGQRAAAGMPDTHTHLRPQVHRYATLLEDLEGTDFVAFGLMYLFTVVLIVVICSNVALLMFARAATREAEIVVRSALGASRSRIGAQMFMEALVLGVFAAALGLAAAEFTLDRWGTEFLATNLGRLPFWLSVDLSLAAVLWALGLTVLGAAIAGLLPALKVTRGLGSRLRQEAPGSGGLQFGGVWTAVIVAQVALTVVFPAVALLEHRLLTGLRSYDAGFTASEYLGVRIASDEGSAATAGPGTEEARQAQFVASLELLRSRVAQQPGVLGVTFVDRLPRTYHRERRIELDHAAMAPDETSYWVHLAAVDDAYFDVLQAPILAGRSFGPADLGADSRAVIVDQAFVDEVLRGQNAVGRRIRFAAQPTTAADLQEAGPWYEIVGVVPELGMRHPTQARRAAGLYLPVLPGSEGPVNMLVHTRGEPIAMAPAVRTLATSVDPTLRLASVQGLDSVTDDVIWFVGVWLRITVVLTALTLLLSLAGIYAVLSFTVARRTREIGIRIALGACRRRLVAATFRRPLLQVGAGVLMGAVVIGIGGVVLSGELPLADSPAAAGGTAVQVLLFASYIALMAGVCMLACIVPLRRVLGVEPTEALRSQ